VKKPKLEYDFYTSLNQRIIDGALAGLCFYVAYQLRFDWNVPAPYSFQLWCILPAIMAGRVLVNSALGVYRLMWRYISLTDALAVGRGLIVFSAVLLVFHFMDPHRWGFFRVPRSIIAIDFLLALTAMLSARVLRRLLYHQQWVGLVGRGKVSANRVLLIGAGSAGIQVAKEIAFCPDFKVVGFLDDDPKKNGLTVHGLPVLGPTQSLQRVVERYSVNQIVVCIARPPRVVLRRLWATCESLAVQIKTIPTLDEILQGQVNIAAFRDVQMQDLLGRETIDLFARRSEVEAVYQAKRILVTGAGGSIGSELVRQLMDLKPAELIALDKDENGLFELCSRFGSTEELTERKIHPVVADIRFPARIRGIFSHFRPEVIFHAAAHKHVPLMEMNPSEAILNNVSATRDLVDLSLEYGVSRFVLISTDKAVRPTSIMGATKRLCEMIVQARSANGKKGHTNFACVRFGNVMGSRGSVIPLFQEQIVRGGPVTVTHPEVERYLMTIPEAVFLVIQAGALGSMGEVFILDMGDPVGILHLASDLIELYGMQPGKDIEVKVTELRPGEKVREELIDGASESLASTGFDHIFVVQSKPFDATPFARKLAELEEAARNESLQEIYRILGELNIGFQFRGLNG
jgi:FlaA1/EpsC-like NDP-sugar epimerase